MFNMPLKYVSSGLFSFNGEWIHPDRILNDNEIIVMVAGTAKICVENENFLLNSGDVLIIPKGKRHYGFEKSYGLNSFYWGHFTVDNNINTQIFSDIDISSLNFLFKQLVHTAHSNHYNSLTKDYYISLILLELEHLVAYKGKQNNLVEEIKDYIRLNYQNVSVLSVSKQFGYNQDYLSRIFKKSLGISIQKFIISVKIEIGKEMLSKTHMTIGTVGAALGYQDYKSFSKVFRQSENMTPSEFRNIFATRHTNIK